jgi:hypothetical protein
LLKVTRFAPDPLDPSTSLQFEVCEPITNVAYKVTLQVTADEIAGPISANLVCELTVVVVDENDQPLFAEPVSASR